MNKQRVKQKARLVYIHEPDSPDCTEIFSGQDKWKLKITDNFTDASDLIKLFKPDVVLIDYLLLIAAVGRKKDYDISSLLFNNNGRRADLNSSLAMSEKSKISTEHGAKTPNPKTPSLADLNIKDKKKHIKDKKNRTKPAMIALFSSCPDSDIRADVLSAGFDDFLIVPFLFGEFQSKMKIHLNQNELTQRLLWKKKKIIAAFDHIEKLKTELVKTKKAFFEEKNILHNSLKQINIMTLERGRLKKQLCELDISFNDNVKWIQSFLVKMIESRNEKNKGHSRRVADIAVFVAKGFGFKENDIETVKKACMLHELGMLFIPGSIFLKDSASLSVYEKDMFDRAPVYGADILEQCSGFKKVADTIRHINENVDGSGVPDGLKRRYIPMMSRIVAGADVLDNFLTDDLGIPVEGILSELEACAGERLDPNVVNYLERYVVISLNKGTEKVKEVGLYQLKPGMKTGAGLFTSTGTKLFSAGTVLTEDSINMVVKYNMAYPVDETVIIKAE